MWEWEHAWCYQEADLEELKAVTDALAIEKKKNQDLRAEIQTITQEVKLSNSHEDKNVRVHKANIDLFAWNLGSYLKV